MEKGISIKVLYYAEQKAINELYDLNGIDKFRKELSEEYVSVVQGKPGDLGGLEKFLIDMIANISLESFAKLIIEGLAFDLIKSGTKSFVLRPFINAYKKLKSKNEERLDIERFSIIFEDTTIHIYSIYDNSVINQLESILNNVALHYSLLVASKNEKPAEIHIPVFHDESDDRLSPFRVKLDVDETIQNFSEKDFSTYWGIFYEYSNQWIVYDLNNGQLVKEEFLPLQQYWQKWEMKRR